MTWKNDEAEDGATATYKVVVNDEEQYAIWPGDKDTPLGWQETGQAGRKDDCLAYVKEVWVDMRPLSLRKKMEEMVRTLPSPHPRTEQPDLPSLVDRLSKGTHLVEIDLRQEKTATLIKEALSRDFVNLKFPETQGGTELGITLEREACDFGSADLDNGQGTVHLEGGLMVDYVAVRCIADIDLYSLQGSGRLVRN